MNKFKKIIFILLLTLTITGCHKKDNAVVEKADTIIEIEKIDYAELYKEEINEVKRLTDINDDFVALLNVGDQIVVDEIVARDIDNNEYIHKDFYTKEYSMYGTSFMDYRNNPDFETSKNIIIYGHYVYESARDGIHVNFTNLHDLIDQNNYEKNKNATMLTKDGIREYKLAAIYYINEYDLADGVGPLYYITDFTNEEFETYLNEIKNAEFYDTGVELSYDDKLLTLQTCVENRKELRLIVVFKETNRINFYD